MSSTETLQWFITQTLPFTVFSEGSEKTLSFSPFNPPLKNLEIRVQHWGKPVCPHRAIMVPDLLNSCENKDGWMKDQLKIPLKMADGSELAWTSAEENKDDTIIKDDGIFQDEVDGSGYVLKLDYSRGANETAALLKDMG